MAAIKHTVSNNLALAAFLWLGLVALPSVGFATDLTVLDRNTVSDQPPVGDFGPKPNTQIQIIDDGLVKHQFREAPSENPRTGIGANSVHNINNGQVHRQDTAGIKYKKTAQQKFIDDREAYFRDEIDKARKISGTKEELINHLIKPLPASYNIPKAFYTQARIGLNCFPRDILAILIAHKITVFLAEKSTDVKPDIAHRKMSKNTNQTHAASAGLYLSWKNAIAIGATSKREGEYGPNLDVPRAVRHEVGHALDAIILRPSWNKVLNQAHRTDEAQLKLSAKSSNAYYLQPGHRGVSETFAELVAAHYYRPTSPTLNRIEESFPSSYAIVASILPQPDAQICEFAKLTNEREKLEAAKDYEGALNTQRKIALLASEIDSSGYLKAITLYKSASLQTFVLNVPAAQSLFEECISVASEQSPFEDTLVADAKCEKAHILLQFGLWKEALLLCLDAEKTMKACRFEKSFSNIDLLITKSSALRQKGDYDDALTTADGALKLAEQKGDDPYQAVLAKLRIAQVHLKKGEKDTAETELKTLANICETSKFAALLTYIKTRLAEISLDKGDLSQAQKLSGEGLRQYSDHEKENSPFLIDDLVVAARILTEQKQFEKAENTLTTALGISEKTGYNYDINRIDAWRAYARLLSKTERQAQADSMTAQADAMQKAYQL